MDTDSERSRTTTPTSSGLVTPKTPLKTPQALLWPGLENSLIDPFLTLPISEIGGTQFLIHNCKFRLSAGVLSLMNGPLRRWRSQAHLNEFHPKAGGFLLTTFGVVQLSNIPTDFSIFKSSYAPLFRKEDLLSFALSDAASLHALLVHSALNLRGIEQLKQDPDMLYHQGETIRLINDRLRDPEQQVASDATIFTVANMTHLEVCFLSHHLHLSCES